MHIKITLNGIISKTMHLLYFLWMFFVVAFSDKVTTYANFCSLLIMGLAALQILRAKQVYMPKQLKILMVFILYSYMTVAWSLDSNATMERSKTMLRLFVLLFLLVNYVKITSDFDFLFHSIEYSANAVSIYTIYNYGFSHLQTIVQKGEERLGGEFANENTLGMFCAIGVVVSLYFIIYRQQNMRFFLVGMPLVISLLTASRKAFLILVLGPVIIVAFKMKKSNSLFKYIRLVIITALMILAFYYLYMSPLGYGLRVRMESLGFGNTKADASADLRYRMIRRGINKFKENPFLGTGIGSSGVYNEGTYLHNNYVELLATSGLVGFSLYYSIYVISISTLLKKLKFEDNDMLNIATVLMLLLVVLDIGAVGFFSKTTYQYFAVIFTACILSNKELNDKKEIKRKTKSG